MRSRISDSFFHPRGLQHIVEIHEDIAIAKQLIILENDADTAAQVGDVLAAKFPKIEARDHAFANHERHLGIECLQERRLTASDTPDQVDKLASRHTQIDLREDHLALTDQPLGREVVASMINRDLLKSDHLFLLHAPRVLISESQRYEK